MQQNDRANTAEQAEGSKRRTSRRRVLRTASAAIAGTTAVWAASDATVAAATEIAEIDLRGGAPPVSAGPQNRDEVIFAVHGYSESDESVAEARGFQSTAQDLGYDGTVAAVTWDDGGLPWSAEDNARDAGSTFAEWLDGFRQENPDTTIRLLGYSMGAIVVMETLAAIDGAFTVANADMMASYEQADAPCPGSFASAIESSCVGMYNYWSANDGIARLGSSGAACDSPAANYTDVEVTDSVGGHTDYRGSRGCVQTYLDNLETGGGSDPLSVSTGEAADVGQTEATLSGRLEALGDGSSATVGFQYRVAGTDEWTSSDRTTRSSVGSYTRTVSDLEPGTEYEFRAIGGRSDRVDEGAIASFTTSDGGGGGSGPAIESLDVDSDCYWSCEFDVQWAVTAGDADLATVQAELYDEDGGQIDAESTDVSGSEASGTSGLRSGWFDDPKAIVFRVTDEAGKTVTERLE